MNQPSLINPDDHQGALSHLNEHGFVVLDRLLSPDDLARVRQGVDAIMKQERNAPFDPGDGPASAEDEAMAAYLRESYRVSSAELAREMKRIRHTRTQNHGTPCPVEASRVSHSFLHLPLLLDGDKSQRVFNLPAKLDACGTLIEHPSLMKLMADLLDEDFILSDLSATSIGPGTGGVYWHVDAPLTMLPEPLPDIALAVQTVWMLDDFTIDNGATHVVPGSHLTRRKPP